MADKINLLIVDDEQIILDSIEKHLQSDDHFVIHKALNVNEAMKIIKGKDIKIILTDLMMPDIDGLEFIKMVKDINPKALIIMITGYATINTALQAMQLGAFDYIAKPFTRAELRNVVNRAFELTQATDSNNRQIIGKDLYEAIPLQGVAKHSWMMLLDDGNVMIGTERPFVINMGKIQTVYLPSIGDEIRQGSVYFQAFSNDLRTQSLFSPLSGIVSDVNSKVLADPNTALQDPYGEGWLIKIKPTNFDEEIKLLGL